MIELLELEYRRVDAVRKGARMLTGLAIAAGVIIVGAELWRRRPARLILRDNETGRTILDVILRRSETSTRVRQYIRSRHG